MPELVAPDEIVVETWRRVLTEANLSEPRIVVITICRNNPHDLLVTCRSVFLQTIKADKHIVIDGSSPSIQNRMEKIGRHFGAEYYWKSPDGIYAAMLSGLDLVADEDYVWFLNATDWAATPQAILEVKLALRLELVGEKPPWLIGRTVVNGKPAHILPMPASGSKFANLLLKGEIGLPHSSTVVHAASMRQVETFQGPFRISRDYEMGLRLVQKYGPPRILEGLLSVYDDKGESARQPIRNYLHKVEARILHQSIFLSLAEPYRIVRALRREILRRALKIWPDLDRLWRETGWEKVNDSELLHYCMSDGPWPNCCLVALSESVP